MSNTKAKNLAKLQPQHLLTSPLPAIPFEFFQKEICSSGSTGSNANGRGRKCTNLKYWDLNYSPCQEEKQNIKVVGDFPLPAAKRPICLPAPTTVVQTVNDSLKRHIWAPGTHSPSCEDRLSARVSLSRPQVTTVLWQCRGLLSSTLPGKKSGFKQGQTQPEGKYGQANNARSRALLP